MNKFEIILSLFLGIGMGILLGLQLTRKRDRELLKEMYDTLEQGKDITPHSVYHYSLMVLFINKIKTLV